MKTQLRNLYINNYIMIKFNARTLYGIGLNSFACEFNPLMLKNTLKLL